jgi:glycosyltransferase involved in cell wall biosynthesis
VISFIIPAHNEAALIGATLKALHEAVLALDVEHETIVVADACSDGTAAIAEACGARVLQVDHRHIAATRNAGAAAASGEILVFIDADTQVDAVVLQAALAALHDGSVGGGAGVRLLGELSWYERWGEALFLWIFRIARIAPGCFVFCRRSAFEAAGGFDSRYYAGEDVAFSRALSRQGRFVILRETVRTSARKLRTFTALEHLQLGLRLLFRGRRLLHSRDQLELWYGERRREGQESRSDTKHEVH